MLRHALGVLGVLAAGVLLAVSAAMNWSFGYSLGRTDFDGQIYGAASVAADCMKALVPFFFFAAIRNRMWSQAAASAVVMVRGHSLLADLRTWPRRAQPERYVRQRVHQAQSYKDLRTDLERDRGQLAGIPQHRPAGAVQSELDGLKTKREWSWTSGCTDIKSKSSRDYCQQIHALLSELASAQQAAALEARIADNQAKVAQYQAGAHTAQADPQAAVLAKLASTVRSLDQGRGRADGDDDLHRAAAGSRVQPGYVHRLQSVASRRAYGTGCSCHGHPRHACPASR